MDIHAENRLVSVSGGGTTASFVYDASGQRVKGVVGATSTYYVDGHFEWSGSTSTMKKYYVAAGVRLAVRVGTASGSDKTGLTWLFPDHLGRTHAAVLTSGTTRTGEVRYAAWGITRYSSGTTPTTYRFTGQREEQPVAGGIYYYGARWYDGSLGRFLSADSIIPLATQGVQAWDRYAGMNNNPIKYSDPTGHMVDDGCRIEGCEQKSQYDEKRYYYKNCQSGYGGGCPKTKDSIIFIILSLVTAGAAGPVIDAVGGVVGGGSQSFVVTCLMNPICAATVFGISTNTANSSYSTNRAVDLHNAIPNEIAQRMRTTAVLTTKNGITLVASSEPYIDPVQRSLLLPNEIEVMGQAGVHAEMKLIISAISSGLEPSLMYVSRFPVCSACQAVLNFFNIPFITPK